MPIKPRIVVVELHGPTVAVAVENMRNRIVAAALGVIAADESLRRVRAKRSKQG